MTRQIPVPGARSRSNVRGDTRHPPPEVTMRVRRHTAALIITSTPFAAGVVPPAAAQTGKRPGNGNANGHQKLHCRAFHATGVGVDAGNGTTTAILYRGNREIGTTFGTFEPG